MRIKSIFKQIPGLGFIYKKYVVFLGKFRVFKNRILHNVYNEEDLINMFPLIGLKPNDKIVINSAMSKIGVLKDGPITLINALKRYLTPEGLIVMPAYPHRGAFEYLEHYTLFDVAETPSKNGAITECFRKSEGVYRSAHPTHSLCAWGKNAQLLMSGHELSKSPYDDVSPYKKLLDLNVKSLCIGVNFDHMIMIRIIDDLYEDYPIMPYIPNKTYKVPVKMEDGTIVQVETPCHDPNYFAIQRRNMKFFKEMKPYITFGKLGQAETWLLPSQDMYRIQVEKAKAGEYAFNEYRFKNDL